MKIKIYATKPPQAILFATLGKLIIKNNSTVTIITITLTIIIVIIKLILGGKKVYSVLQVTFNKAEERYSCDIMTAKKKKIFRPSTIPQKQFIMKTITFELPARF